MPLVTPHCPRRRWRGQAMVLVLAFLSVLMVSMLVLFNTGKLTHDKIELQNAADSVAYSAAVLEARHLNFTAYTNRAMIANEVALGQTIGLATWLMKWGGSFISIGNILNMILTPIPIVGPAIAAVVKAVFTTLGNAFAKFSVIVGKFAAIYAKLVSGLNTFYGYSQLAFRIGTYETILFNSDDLVTKNAPNARLGSLAEFVQFLNLFLFEQYNKNCKPTDARSKSTTPEEHTEQNECMQKMAAAVNNSRDDWTKNRSNGKLGVNEEISKTIPLLGKFGVKLKLGIFGEGGSTMRYLAGGSTGAARDKGHFNWSSMDTNEFKFGLGIWLFSAYAGFEIPMPLGWGTMQLAHQSKTNHKLFKITTPGPMGGDTVGTAGWGDQDAEALYGDSWKNNLATSAMASLGFDFYPWGVGKTTQGGENPKGDYGDLSPFHTIDPDFLNYSGEKWSFSWPGSMPPPYVVWVYKPESKIRTSDNMGKGSPKGDLALDTKAASSFLPQPVGEVPGLQAIASGEIYYHRADDEPEEPNAFSPYWQARLGQTDNLILFLAMGAQSPNMAYAFTGINQGVQTLSDQVNDLPQTIMDELTDTDAIVDEAVGAALGTIDPTGTLQTFWENK